ncbi:hypothetical protein JL49_19610 [Pseudoalteromonas luteoviolacea]|nr:hypothetical protein JL49_19610 [Pseudoalteromonas luteoviolacea]
MKQSEAKLPIELERLKAAAYMSYICGVTNGKRSGYHVEHFFELDKIVNKLNGTKQRSCKYDRHSRAVHSPSQKTLARLYKASPQLIKYDEFEPFIFRALDCIHSPISDWYSIYQQAPLIVLNPLCSLEHLNGLASESSTLQLETLKALLQLNNDHMFALFVILYLDDNILMDTIVRWKLIASIFDYASNPPAESLFNKVTAKLFNYLKTLFVPKNIILTPSARVKLTSYFALNSDRDFEILEHAQQDKNACANILYYLIQNQQINFEELESRLGRAMYLLIYKKLAIRNPKRYKRLLPH